LPVCFAVLFGILGMYEAQERPPILDILEFIIVDSSAIEILRLCCLFNVGIFITSMLNIADISAIQPKHVACFLFVEIIPTTLTVRCFLQ